MMDRSELERVYDDHAPAAFGLFVRFAGCESDARDLLQDWIVKVARGHDSLAGVRCERSYLMRVAYRHAVDWSRRVKARRRRDREAGSGGEGGGEVPAHPVDPDREFFRRSLDEAMSSLPPEQLVVVQLRLCERMGFADIGEVAGVSANTAASRYRYGLQKLREMLGPVYDEL